MKPVNVDYYECEVCGTAYETREQALACEAAGRPEPRFQANQQVRLVDHSFAGIVPEGPYEVKATTVQLKEPAWAEGPDSVPTPGEHITTYVLQGGRWRLSFVPEEAMTSLER